MSSWGFSEIPHAIPGNKTTCMAPRLNYDCFVAPLLIHGEPSRGQPGGRCARDGYRAGEPLGALVILLGHGREANVGLAGEGHAPGCLDPQLAQ